MMRLFYAPGTCALAPHIVLEWIGAPFAAEKVDPRSDAYRAINPLGMVPALQDGTPRIMTQADAILKYLAARHAEARLDADDDIAARFDLDEALAFMTGDMHPAFWPFFAPGRYTTRTDDAALEHARAASHPRIDRAMTHLDGLLADTGHVSGGRRTIADPYAFAMARWTDNLPKTWRDYPAIPPFMDTMLDDAGVKRAMAMQGL